MWAITVLSFIIIQLPPGDFVDAYIARLSASGSSVSAAEAQGLRQLYGLDQPYFIQYLKWMGRLLRGDFGESMEWQRPVAEVLGDRLWMTVVLSFAAALGGSLILFELFADFPGEDPSYPLFAFIFLVALGVDYNIFLMARVREERLALPTREAMLRGLAVTGGVITSAGIVLAGTFSVLAVLPLVALTQIGVTVAFGVLLDTLVVRSVLVPALTFDLGDVPPGTGGRRHVFPP